MCFGNQVGRHRRYASHRSISRRAMHERIAMFVLLIRQCSSRPSVSSTRTVPVMKNFRRRISASVSANLNFSLTLKTDAGLL
jgi:hypothetical protein